MKQGVLLQPARPTEDMGITESQSGTNVTVMDNHWAFIQRCWAENPLDRPTVEEVSAHVQWFYAAPSRNPTPESVRTNHRVVRLLRRRSIIVEDEPSAGQSGGGGHHHHRDGSRARLSVRPRSIVNDNDSSDEEYLDAVSEMGNLHT